MTTNDKQQYELTILLDENGIKRLAYNIKGHEKARYLFYYLELDTYRHLTEELSTNSDVLRYLLVRTLNCSGGNR